MNKKFFTGDSVRQALLQAARHFKVEPEEVAYREVDRRHGFLRGRRRAVIEVDLDNPLRARAQAEAPEPEDGDERARPAPPVAAGVAPISPDERPTEELPVSPAETAGAEVTSAPERAPVDEPGTAGETSAFEPAAAAEAAAREPAPPAVADAPPGAEDTGVDDGPEAGGGERVAATGDPDPELAAAARQALDRIFELGRLDLEIQSIGQGEEKLEVELRGEDEELLLEDRGRLLLAIQHLLPRMLRGLTGRSTPCLVDCDDFHEIRTEQLRDLAQRVASEVRNRRRSRTLEPMSPDERRIVHLTLADDPAVETVSQGNGLFKRVQIRPQKMQPRGFDPFGRE